jgi:uncharacterized protein (UPF0548 family)
MTFSFRRPNEAAIQALIARQTGQTWSYDWPEITRSDPARRPGWQIDRHRVLLGRGVEVFEAACLAICEWRMFPRQMCEVFRAKGSGVFCGAESSMTVNACPPKTPDPLALPQPGDVVAVLYRSHVFRLWMLFPARVVYAMESDSQLVSDRNGRTTFGFAYGTLPDHPERGEERFLIEWNHADDSVWYGLLAFSRPAHWLARIGYPYARYEQAKFRRLSGLAMQAAVRSTHA